MSLLDFFELNAFDGFVGVCNDPALHDKLPFWLNGVSEPNPFYYGCILMLPYVH